MLDALEAEWIGEFRIICKWLKITKPHHAAHASDPKQAMPVSQLPYNSSSLLSFPLVISSSQLIHISRIDNAFP